MLRGRVDVEAEAILGHFCDTEPVHMPAVRFGAALAVRDGLTGDYMVTTCANHRMVVYGVDFARDVIEPGDPVKLSTAPGDSAGFFLAGGTLELGASTESEPPPVGTTRVGKVLGCRGGRGTAVQPLDGRRGPGSEVMVEWSQGGLTAISAVTERGVPEPLGPLVGGPAIGADLHRLADRLRPAICAVQGLVVRRYAGRMGIKCGSSVAMLVSTILIAATPVRSAYSPPREALSDLPPYTWAAPLALVVCDVFEAVGTLAFQRHMGSNWKQACAELAATLDPCTIRLVVATVSYCWAGTLVLGQDVRVCL